MTEDPDTDLCRCANCDWEGPMSQTRPIRRLGERVEPGEEMPAGECPQCGALAHLASGSSLYGVKYTIRSGIDRSVVASNCLSVRAASESGAKVNVVRLVHELDPHADARIDPIVEIESVVKADVPDVDTLSREALIEIAEYARDGLFLDVGPTGEFYNPEKEVSGADYIEHMSLVLGKHGVVPDERTPDLTTNNDRDEP
jgi:hypothetical protein